METLAGIGLFILGAAWVATSLMCIFGLQREWARAKPVVLNRLARNFMPYTFLAVGLNLVGLTPHMFLDDPPVFVSLFTLITVGLGVPIGLISMVHWPLFLSPPWYRRWYKRGGRMGNKAPLWDPSEKKNTTTTR
ncbi:hypothetical protein F7P69_05330 [Cellulosimicrobium funkei]|nr:hypothetical protein [Cellulosimicrobium funkei]